jgi:hypothetical protein
MNKAKHPVAATHPPVQAPRVKPKLKLPHERDESVGAAGEAPRKVIEQAHRDLEAGQVDTDMRATPGLDAQRRRKLVKSGPG